MFNENDHKEVGRKNCKFAEMVCLMAELFELDYEIERDYDEFEPRFITIRLLEGKESWERRTSHPEDV